MVSASPWHDSGLAPFMPAVVNGANLGLPYAASRQWTKGRFRWPDVLRTALVRD
jgi:hypothetical protein